MQQDQAAIPLAELYTSVHATGLVRRVLELARDEDLGSGAHAGDITSLVCIPASATVRAAVVARAAGVIAGLACVPELLDVFGADIAFEPRAQDGQRVPAGTAIAILSGPARHVLAIERTALNLVGRLSGVATGAAEFVRAVEGTGAHIYDTRKTTPGLRVLEKYAVRCGGGRSHRLGLHDAVLIKDNHIAGVTPDRLPRVVHAAAAEARRLRPGLQFVELEVDTLEQLRAGLTLDPGVVDIILLDNMELAAMREAVRLRDSSRAKPQLEASGGVRLETVRAIAETGVERISAGALTHSAVVLDVALDLDSGRLERGPA